MAGDYVLDAPYTWGFFDHQNPWQLAYVANLNNFEAPSIDQDFTYCDLGCGNGVSVNLLASIFAKGQFVGVDFNGEHIKNAKSIATKGAVTNAHFYQADFSTFTKTNTTQFDYIVLHGIYSWVSEDIRRQTRDFIEKFLKPGGVVYVSYNCLPGWSQLLPVWKMVQGFNEGSKQNSVEKVKSGLKKLAMLQDKNARFFRNNKAAGRFVERLRAGDVNYVAHEIGNEISEPHYFVDIAKKMQAIDLTYAGTTKIHRNKVENIISSALMSHVNEGRDVIDRESRKSFIRNEAFRRDIFVKTRQKAKAEQAAKVNFMGHHIGAVVVADRINEALDLGYRKISKGNMLFRDLRPLAASGQFTVRQLVDHPVLKPFTELEIVDAIDDLLAGYQFQVIRQAVRPYVSGYAGKYQLVSQMNKALLEARIWQEGKTYLGSAILGSAVRVKFVEGLMVLALDGHSLTRAGQIVAKQLRAMTPEEQRRLSLDNDVVTETWIAEMLDNFEKQRLPIYVNYDIVRPR